MSNFNQILDELRAYLPPLYPQTVWKPDLSARIAAQGDEELFGAQVADPGMASACRAGLLLWNDDIGAAHSIAQSIENPTGSFWHAIMHRREGDAPNSGYWWRRTGAHPAFPVLYEAALKTLNPKAAGPEGDFVAELHNKGTWHPVLFVETCERAQQNRAPDEWLRRLQVLEMEVLLDWCAQRAV